MVTGDIDARVLLISQAGDQDTPLVLYDISRPFENRARRKATWTRKFQQL